MIPVIFPKVPWGSPIFPRKSWGLPGTPLPLNTPPWEPYKYCGHYIITMNLEKHRKLPIFKGNCWQLIVVFRGKVDIVRCKELAFQGCDRERFSNLSSAYICNHIIYMLETHNVFQGLNASQKFMAFKFSICSSSQEGSMGVMKMKRRYAMSFGGIPRWHSWGLRV